MDRELPDEERARIARIVLGHPAVKDVHASLFRKDAPAFKK